MEKRLSELWTVKRWGWKYQRLVGPFGRTLFSYQQVAPLTFQLPEEARWRSREPQLFQCCLPSTGWRHGCSRARGSCHAGFHADTHRRETIRAKSSRVEPKTWRLQEDDEPRLSCVGLPSAVTTEPTWPKRQTLSDMNAFIETLSKNVSKVFSLKKRCSIFNTKTLILLTVNFE